MKTIFFLKKKKKEKEKGKGKGAGGCMTTPPHRQGLHALRVACRPLLLFSFLFSKKKNCLLLRVFM
jgi:hypothetical protein